VLTKETADEVTVTEFEPIYQEQVIDLILHVQNVENGVNISLEEQPDLLDIDGCYSASGGRFWVALNRAGTVVGTIGLQKKTGSVGVLKKFFVYAAYRGRETNSGSKLFDALLAFSLRQGLNTIVLDTPSIATRSHAFYKRMGFRQISEADLPVQYDYPNRNSLFFRLDCKTEAR
jgi:N-acetylglutamate synthase-like GNAT family acetyltransferase